MIHKTKNITDARHVALMILLEVIEKKQPLDLLLERDFSYHNLESRDKAFARLLIVTVLRHTGQFDAIIRSFLDKPKNLDSAAVWMILRLALAQIIFLKTPDHAVVNTSVDLANQSPFCPRQYKNLINAVLRKITQEQIVLPSLYLNIPLWLQESWIRDFGADQAKAIIEAGLKEPFLDVSVKNNPEQWAKNLDGMLLPTGSIRLPNTGSIFEKQGFEEGSWWVQDAAAALPAKLFGDIKGKKIIDLCAAPGGKTAQLALSGADVIALDRSPTRMKRLEDNQRRLNFKTTPIVADGAVWQPLEKADAVLLDAPCSATGTIRRHPDLLYLKTLNDVERLIKLQKSLMLNAAKMVKSGGLFIYCTCSLQKAEGEEQMNWFLQKNPEFSLLKISAQETGLKEIITQDGAIRTLPCHLKEQGGMDGFFIARFIKK